MVAENKKLFTAESVTEGHPDKIADQISDAILDAALTGDPNSRVACETLVTTGLVVIAGEITTNCYIPIDQVARNTIREIGYDHSSKGFDCNTCAIVVTVGQQSQDIADGVDIGGAGDQGLMFGYATLETPALMPAPIYYANALTLKLSEVRKSKQIEWLRPDGKSQVTVEFHDDKIVRIHTVVISSQHDEYAKNQEIRDRIINEVIKPTLPSDYLDKNTIYHINPTGRFVTGGPMGDTGLTGRKIIVDTYGGSSHHGGGAFSGKDPSKVDRSAAYMCRYISKNIVAAGIAQRCEIQLAYAIGIAEPVSIAIDTFNTGIVDDARIIRAVREVFDCTPKAMIENLNLRKPIYRSTAAYGHFGRSEFSWEQTDKIQDLISAINILDTLP
jgi:S-adenosylmethionine synthetase